MLSNGNITKQRSFFVFALYFIFVTWIWIDFIKPGFMGRDISNFENMVNGTAHRPYVTRVLVPITLNAVQIAVPTHTQSALADTHIGHRLHAKFSQKGLVPKSLFVTYAVMLSLFWFLFAGTLWFLRLLTRQWLDHPLAVDLMPLVGFILIRLMMMQGSYLYDPATLCIVTAGAYCLSIKSFSRYYLVFLLAVLNKETSIALIPAFGLRYWNRTKRDDLYKHIAVQLSIWCVVRGAIMFFYRDAHGATTEFHLFSHNLAAVAVFTKLMSLAIVIFFGAVIGCSWRAKPPFIRSTFLVTFLPLVALTMIFGYVEELRDYYESVPYAYLLILDTFARFYQLTPVEPQKPEKELVPA